MIQWLERTTWETMENSELKEWFCREILPLEAGLTKFIRAFWQNEGEVTDIRQDIYESVLTAAAEEYPSHPKAYAFAIARNLMINRARRNSIVRIELIESIETLPLEPDWLTPYRYADAREELRRVQARLDRLPPRCREVIRLRKVEGLSIREVASRLGISHAAVEQQATYGMRALTDFMLGGEGKISRPKKRLRIVKRNAND